MANKKFTELTDLPSPAGADILAIVDDVAGMVLGNASGSQQKSGGLLGGLLGGVFGKK